MNEIITKGKSIFTTIIAGFFTFICSYVFAQQNIDSVEYAVDNIGDFGKATKIAVSPAQEVNNIPFTVDIASLSNGFHTLFVRTHSTTTTAPAKGYWSQTNNTYFFKQNNAKPAVSKIKQLEYFIDTDPGESNATPISVSAAAQVSDIAFNPSIGNLSAGFHVLFIRGLDEDGKWSVTNYQYFYKQNNISTQVSTVKSLEYFVDTDPGFGKGKNIAFNSATNISALNFDADLSDIGAGFHVLFIRSADADGKWAITNYAYFYKAGPQQNTAANIVKIEYFIDTDPGYFSATNIPVSPAPDIANKAFLANTSGLSEGLHYLFVRSLDTRDKWSINALDSFRINGSLPVKWLSFAASLQADSVLINWQTAAEVNNGFYSIEKSIDGISFSSIGQVKAAGNSTVIKNYQFVDENPLQSINYYRIKQVDKDGNFSYSIIAAIQYDGSKNFARIYPNPANTIVNILFNQQTEKNASLKLLSANGQVVQSYSISGIKNKRISVSTLPNGVYELRVLSGKIHTTKKLIVQH